MVGLGHMKPRRGMRLPTLQVLVFFGAPCSIESQQRIKVFWLAPLLGFFKQKNDLTVPCSHWWGWWSLKFIHLLEISMGLWLFEETRDWNDWNYKMILITLIRTKNKMDRKSDLHPSLKGMVMAMSSLLAVGILHLPVLLVKHCMTHYHPQYGNLY